MSPRAGAATTRETLLSSATDLLDEGGPERVTLREVGRRAGVSHNAPYKHFASKDALLAEVATRELCWLIGVIDDAVVATASPTQAVHLVMRMYVARSLAHPERFVLVFSRWHSEPEELSRTASTAWQKLVGVVEAAQEARELPPGDPERLTALIRSLVHGAIDLARSGHLARGQKGNAEPDDLLGDLFGLFGALHGPAR